MTSEQPQKKRVSQVTVQPFWKRAADGTVYAHAELRLRGAWLLDWFPLHTKVCITPEQRDGQTVLVISAVERFEHQKEETHEQDVEG